MSKASTLKLLVMNASWLGLSFMWNGLHVITLPAFLLNFVDSTQKNTILGLLTGAGLLIAIVIQPIAGALSDQWRSRWGRRRPLILLGTSFDMVFLAVMALAGGIPGLAVGYLGLQFSSNFSHGSMQGLLPDLLPARQLGRGSAVKTVLDMIGLVMASLLLGNLVSPDQASILLPMGITAGVMLISTGITLLGIREKPSAGLSQNSATEFQLKDVLKIDFRGNRAFLWLVVARLVFLLGVFGIQAFAQYFVRDTLVVDNPVKLTGDLMAVIVIGLVGFSLLAGFLNDRFGSRLVHVFSAILIVIGSLLMATAKQPSSVLLFGSIIGAGIGLFLTTNWALATSLAPSSEAGKYLGLTNLATAGAGALSRLFGPIIDSINAVKPAMGYTVLFISSAVFALIGLFLVNKVFPLASAQSRMAQPSTSAPD